MLVDFATPFLRGARSHWGTSAEGAGKAHCGDHHVPEPRWQWTHAIHVATKRSKPRGFHPNQRVES
jgi:hypothetical protein